MKKELRLDSIPKYLLRSMLFSLKQAEKLDVGIKELEDYLSSIGSKSIERINDELLRRSLSVPSKIPWKKCPKCGKRMRLLPVDNNTEFKSKWKCPHQENCKSCTNGCGYEEFNEESAQTIWGKDN